MARREGRMFIKGVRAHGWLAPWVAVFAVFVGRFWFLCDDAYISFRFSRNWARGLGVVFNPGEFPPVEGYSNFLWVAAGALVELVGAPIEWVMPLLSAACGVALLVRIGQVAVDQRLSGPGRHVAVALFALSPSAAVWSTSGLETMPFAWLFFELVVGAALTRLETSAWFVTALAVTMALLRIEGIAWVGVIALAGAAVRGVDSSAVRRFAVPVAGAVAIYALYTAWRVHFFGTWVPNTALVKVSFDVPIATRGLKYLAVFALTAVAPVVAWGMGSALWRDRRWVATFGLVTAVFTYAVVVGGDFMPFGRLLVPALPLTGLLLGASVPTPDRLVIAGPLLAVSALPLVGVHPVPGDWLRPLHFRHSDRSFMTELSRWENQRDNCVGFARRGRALAQVADPGDAVVAGAVGAIGYASDLEVFDQHGLVTKEVAYRTVAPGSRAASPGHDKHVDPSFFVKYAPRFLFARTVSGPLAAGKMKDTLSEWAVPARVQDRYVPDFWEVTEPDEARTFLVVVRHRTRDEDPKRLWNSFAERRRALNAELRNDPRITKDEP